MINQMNANDHTENQFFHALKELQIAKLLHKSNITKSCGETFSDAPCGKSNLAFDRLTRPERVNVLILDTGIHASSCFFLPPVLRFLYTSRSARSCSFSRSSCAIRGGETGKWHWLGCSN